MKIRIRGNSVRIRLSQSELHLFENEGYLQDTTDFGSNVFTYALKKVVGENLNADLSNNTITVTVPEQLMENWCSTNLTSLEHHLPVNENSYLYILLEKDFKCIDSPVTEDQSDYFDNPVKSC